MSDCKHTRTSSNTSTSFTTKRVWDDYAKKWVHLEIKTETTIVKCSDCGTELSRSERTS